MIRRPPISTRTDTLFPYTTLFRSLKPLVATILARGQEVQLHLHPNWAGAKAGDGGAAHARFEMVEYSAHEQRDLIAGAIDLLKAAGAPHPIAFRAGSYGANDETLAALAALGTTRPVKSSRPPGRSEEHTSELQSLMRSPYAVFCLKKKTTPHTTYTDD